jgi:hypothetical protein
MNGKACLVLGWCCGASLLHAQAVLPRVVKPVDDASFVRIGHSAHPAIATARDMGRVPSDAPVERVLLLLRASPEQDAALEQLLTDLTDPRSSRFQQWLTPEQFGEQFGPAQEDVDAITNWLRNRGLTVNRVSKGRRSVEFSGTARDVESAFHTQIHSFEINGELHVANANEIAIPEALMAVVVGVASMHDFRLRPLHHVVARQDAVGIDNDPAGGGHTIVPYDFAKIYNIAPLWSSAYDGTGQSIAIVNNTNIDPNDVTLFRAQFGLPVNHPTIIVDGADPGILDQASELEADLDVEWAGAVAKGASIQLVVAASTNSTDGVVLSSQYIVDNNLAPVMSLSFGGCESDIGSENQFFNSLWQQAAAQGISVFVSAGDSGSAGCDAPSSTGRNGANTTQPASGGFAVNGLASTPYNVAVGGTQFNDVASPGTYWNSVNDANQASAKGYIPEVVWNDSSYTFAGAQANSLYAASGGVSSVYATPAWQTGDGVPTVDPGASAQHHRYLPDVSLTAGSHDGYMVESRGVLVQVAGTSASSPSMAGLMAILNQYTGARSGNPNPRLYSIAAQAPAVFHDVTSGTNAVPCAGGSANCSAATGGAGNAGMMNGYSAGAGYDLATGLGSVDGYALALHWAGAASYAGYLDAANCQSLSGWAADRTRLNQSIVVNIFDGTTLLGSVTANLSRPDVGAFLGDSGLHGFTFALPAIVSAGGSHAIHLVFESSSVELGASPTTLSCSSTSTSPKYEGWADNASCTGINGWAADLNRPGVSIQVSLWFNGIEIASAAANLSRPDVGAALGDNGLHGYTLNPPANYRDGVARTYSVHFESSSTTLSGGSAIQLTCSTAPSYAGYLDSASCSGISGWAANRSALSQSIAVDLVQGSTILLTVLADLSRPDVGAYLGDNGLHGFSFATPAGLRDGAAHILNLRYSGTTQSIGNSPLTLQCSAAPAAIYAGNLDVAGCTSIEGWAADRDHLNASIGVEIYEGTTLVGSAAANGPRPDVGAFLGDNGLHGFSWAAPQILKDGSAHPVSIHPAGSASALPGAQTWTCAP